MIKQVIILQGWYLKPDTQWYPWLTSQLEKRGYKVFVPDLPTIHTALPDMQQQLEYIEKTVRINSDTIVVGHSIGCLLAMRLAEKYKYDKMLLVAGWDYDDLTTEHKLFWPTPIDHKTIKKNVKEIYCISSDNDPYTTAFTVEAMNKRLGGKFVLIKGAGHFTEKFGITKIPQLLPLL